MIAHNIIVSFCIFNLLNYDRIFGKNLEHDTYGLNEILDSGLCGGSDLVSEIYVSFHETFTLFFK